MTNFILLTAKDGEKVLVNYSEVLYFTATQPDQPTFVKLKTGESQWCKESPEKIYQLIKHGRFND